MDVVTALAAIREKGLTEEADILEAAIDEALCDQPIVRIAGGMTADQIAEKVVQLLKSEVQERLPRGIPALPWEVDTQGDAWSADGLILLTEGYIGVAATCNAAGVDRYATIRAIVQAMNGYYSPQTPAEAAAANSETGIPDTAGYPLTDGTAQ